jgi:hypothetical protein
MKKLVCYEILIKLNVSKDALKAEWHIFLQKGLLAEWDILFLFTFFFRVVKNIPVLIANVKTILRLIRQFN